MAGMSGMPGMSGAGGHVGGGASILPEWLAIVWLVVFAAIVASHCRHLLASRGQRRLWHAGHVLMAVGMAFMYAAAASGDLSTPNGLWQVTFGYAAAAMVAWMLVQLLYRRAVNVLWMTMALDLGAMAYMWSRSGLVAPLTWALVAYLVAQATLWGVSAYREIDGRWQLGGGARLATANRGARLSTASGGARLSTANGTGALSVTAARSEPLICNLELRPSLIAMSVGMAYMFVAMQLLS